MTSQGLFDMEIDEEHKIINDPYIFENITDELEEFILDEVEADAEDGFFNIVDDLTNKLQEDYEELIGEDSDKKRFIRSLTRVFALLLNTKVDTVDKIKKILKIAVGTTLKIWQGQK